MSVYVTMKLPALHVDLTPAKRFGHLIYLGYRCDVENGTEQELLWKFREGLKNFDSRKDYLLPLGHLITMTTAAIVAAEMGNGTVRVLQWDRRVGAYEVFTLDLHSQPKKAS